MICPPCTRGDHCGLPGERSTQCFCQHRPRKPQAPASRPPGPSGVPVHQAVPDGPPDGLVAALKDVPTVTLLSAWQNFHTGRAFAAARVVRSLLADRLERAGRRTG